MCASCIACSCWGCCETIGKSWWQQGRHKFAYLTTRNDSFARFACAFFIFGPFADVLVISTTWNDLFWSWLDIWWQLWSTGSNIIPRYLENDDDKLLKKRNYIFRWSSCCRRCCLCLGSLLLANMHTFQENEIFVSKETVVLRQWGCFGPNKFIRVKFPSWYRWRNVADVSSVNPSSLAQTSTSLSPHSGF